MTTIAAPLALRAHSNERRLATWRHHGFGVLRIAFGTTCAIDAWFKWQPGFIDNYSGYLTDAQQPTGQPALGHHWDRVLDQHGARRPEALRLLRRSDALLVNGAGTEPVDGGAG